MERLSKACRLDWLIFWLDTISIWLKDYYIHENSFWNRSESFSTNRFILKEPFALFDKIFGKLCALTKLKGLSLKNNQLTVQLSDYYAYITDQKKAAEFCKASADSQEIIIQRALTSLKGK